MAVGAGVSIVRRVLLSVAVLVGAAWAFTGTAAAHQPVFIDETTPIEGAPLIEDGTVSFAVYGRIDEPGGDASFRVRHGEGQSFAVEVLVPDRAPENGRSSFGHLTLVVTDPNGVVAQTSGAQVLSTFDEPFSKTSYLRVIAWTAPAVPGVSTVTVRSELPTRFTVATGFVERFDGAVSNYTPVPMSELTTWYQTAPPESSLRTTTTTAPATVAPPMESTPAGDDAAPVPARDTAGGGTAWLGTIAAVVLLAIAVGLGVVLRHGRTSPAATS